MATLYYVPPPPESAGAWKLNFYKMVVGPPGYDPTTINCLINYKKSVSVKPINNYKAALISHIFRFQIYSGNRWGLLDLLLDLR